MAPTMGVGVDTTRYDHLPGGINHPGSSRNLKIEANLLDDLVLNVNICPLSSILVDNLTSFD